MKGFVCKVCGFISIDGNAPERCPVCGAPKVSFEAKDDAIKTPKDAHSLSELEKKHIPVFMVVKECTFIQGDCLDVHVKMGEIKHPMKPEHFIQHVDFYIDNKFISRVILTPERLNPAAALHLKAKTGKLTAIALCNLHGAWIKEIDI